MSKPKSPALHSKNNRKGKSAMPSSSTTISSHNIKHKKEMKKKIKKLKAKVKVAKASVANLETQMEREAAVLKEFEAVVEQRRDQNKLHLKMIIWGQLLADHIQTQFNILL